MSHETHMPATTEIPSVAAKLGIVWAGTLWGIKISDLVLLATLVYTVLQIGVLVWDKIIKPWRERKSSSKSSYTTTD